MKSFICSNHTFRGAHAHRAPRRRAFRTWKAEKGAHVSGGGAAGESSAFNAHRTNESFPMRLGYSATRLFTLGVLWAF